MGIRWCSFLLISLIVPSYRVTIFFYIQVFWLFCPFQSPIKLFSSQRPGQILYREYSQSRFPISLSFYSLCFSTDIWYSFIHFKHTFLCLYFLEQRKMGALKSLFAGSTIWIILTFVSVDYISLEKRSHFLIFFMCQLALNGVLDIGSDIL